MIGAGAVIGSLAGGNGNAARSWLPATDIAETVAAVPAAAPRQDSSLPREQAAQQTPELSPAAAIAMRFPPRWHAAAVDPTDAARPAMAYGPESWRRRRRPLPAATSLPASIRRRR